MKTNQSQSNPVLGRTGTSSRPGLLHLVSREEIEALRRSVITGLLPIDFEAKLDRLSGQELLHQFVAEHCRLFFRLLLASHAGLFPGLADHSGERLLKVLAYVRKDNDAIPDFKPNGFQDDLLEVRAVSADLDALLDRFKDWLLRNQVPSLWSPCPDLLQS